MVDGIELLIGQQILAVDDALRCLARRAGSELPVRLCFRRSQARRILLAARRPGPLPEYGQVLRRRAPMPGPGADAAGVFGVFAREGVRVGDTADRVAVRMDCESERCGCTGLVEGGEDVVEDDAGSKSGSAFVRAVGTQLSILVALCDTARQRRPGWLSGARP